MRQSNLETKIVDEVIEKLIDYRGKTPQKTLSGIKLITAKVIKQGRILDGEHEYIASENYDSWMKRGLPKRGDILITTEAPLGEVAQLKTDEKIALAQRVILLRGKRDVIDQNYFFFSLQSPFVQAELASKATGTTVSGIKQSELRQVKIPCFPLLTQRRIATILSAYDELIENNSRRIKILEEMARMIYQEWFVKFRFPGHEQAKFVESPLGMIPAGWEVGTLKDFCASMTYGYTASARKEFIGPKFLRITDIVPDFIDWSNVPYCEISKKEEAKYLLEEGDIVVARTGATVGYAKRLNKKHPKTVFASYLVRLRLLDKLASFYVGILVESNEYKTFIKANASGAAQPQANAQVLTSISLVMPPTQILQKFNSLVQPIFDQKEGFEQKNQNLRQTRDMLLPKLISGEIDVSDLDIPIEER